MKNKKNQKAKRSRWWLLTWWRLRSGKNEKGRKEKWAWRSMEEKWVKRWRLRREEEVKRETKEKGRGSDIHGHVIDESLGCENMLAMRACKCHEEHNREAILELRFSPSNLNLLYFNFNFISGQLHLQSMSLTYQSMKGTAKACLTYAPT